MPDEDKSPETDKGSEAREKTDAEADYSSAFKDITEGKKQDSKPPDSDKAVVEPGKKEKADSKAADEPEPAEKSSEDQEKVEKKDDGEDKEKPGEGEVAETAEQRIERKAKEHQERRAKQEEEAKKAKEEAEDEEKPEKKAKKEPPKEKKSPKPQEEEPEEPPQRINVKELLKDIDLSDEEKEYAEDYGEAISLQDKITAKRIDKEVDRRVNIALGTIAEAVDKQFDDVFRTMAVMRAESYMNEHCPGWKQIVFEKDGKTENKAWWSWVKEQPKMWQKLADSDDPEDNVEILNYYKETMLKKAADKAKESKAEQKKKYDAMHGNSPSGGKAVRESGKASDFSGSFAEFAQ
jgi:hypothetical protein